MSSFETPSLNFFSYNPSEEEHRAFVKELVADPKVNEYLKNVDAFIYQDTGIPLNNAYLVGKGDDIVGYINLYEHTRIVEMDYAVRPSFRGIRNNSNETIGCEILRETSEFLFDNYDFIRFISLYIAKSNIRSIKAAQRAGFVVQDYLFNGDEYRKYPSKNATFK